MPSTDSNPWTLGDFCGEINAQIDAQSELKLYAIAHKGQNPALPHVIDPQKTARCLLAEDADSPLGKLSPYLVSLPKPHADSGIWQWIYAQAPSCPCLMLIATTLSFERLHHQLSQFIEVRLPDKEEMLLAWWDPYILPVLCANADDNTLYLPGPIFTPAQSTALLKHIDAWWYWQRDGQITQLSALPYAEPVQAAVKFPLQLTQAQVDSIVEATLPDLLLANIRENQAELLNDIDACTQYRITCQQLKRARNYTLETVYDLNLYLGIALSYGTQFDELPAIQAVLQKVVKGEINFEAAIDLFDEAALQTHQQRVQVL